MPEIHILLKRTVFSFHSSGLVPFLCDLSYAPHGVYSGFTQCRGYRANQGLGSELGAGEGQPPVCLLTQGFQLKCKTRTNKIFMDAGDAVKVKRDILLIFSAFY